MAVGEIRPEQGVVTKTTQRSVGDTVARLTDILTAKGMRIFGVIDQRSEAESVGLRLRETTLVLFGNPAAGTPVMDAVPLSALDLPLRVLVWSDAGETKVSYYAPTELGRRHGLSQELEGLLAGIDSLTDALVAPDR
jgi:uncharacterized protein (DUF302 family)